MKNGFVDVFVMRLTPIGPAAVEAAAEAAVLAAVLAAADGALLPPELLQAEIANAAATARPSRRRVPMDPGMRS
jgi:hypothetical protein